jgi:type I restriction enzyme S subunit
MNKETNKLIPKLRFPEFENDGKWTVEPLSDVYFFKNTNSFSRDKLNYNNGTVKNIHYGDIHTKFSTLFDITKEIVPFINSDVSIDSIDKGNYCIEGDMIFADASEDLDDVGKSIEIVNLNNEKLVAGLHTFLARQLEPKLVIGFGGHLFKSNSIRTQIKRESQGAKVFGISKGRISGIDIYYPENKAEQQKISACLSSLDDLISAQNDKLEALKNHKKGLVQNLFPQEGETVPMYRFPEFKNDGKWVEHEFSDYVQVIDGDRGVNYPKAEEYSSVGHCIFLNAKNVTKKGFVFNEVQYITKEKDEDLRKGKLNRFDIVLTTRGSLGQFAFYDDNVPFDNIRINSGMVILRVANRAIESEYLYCFCQSNKIKKTIESQAFGNAVQQLTVAVVNNLPVQFPKNKNEQQKIASCFSVLDKLINAQVDMIEQLQFHKKGLMQGLFPKVTNNV